MSNLSLKVHFNNETRRVSIKNNVSFTELVDKLRKMFAELPEGFTVRYRDSDNDVITVYSDDELAEAIRLALRDPEAVLRLVVVSKPPAQPAEQQQQGGHCHRGRGGWWGRYREQCGQQQSAPGQVPAEPQQQGQGCPRRANWFARRQQCAPQTAEGKEIHWGVSCDGCNQFPLVGLRHKSLVKYNFDLCDNCFAKDANKSEYFVISSIPQQEQAAPAPAAPKTEEPAPAVAPSAPVVEDVKPIVAESKPAVVEPVGDAPKVVEVPALVASTEPVNRFEQMLNTLKDMGFSDRQRAIQVLVQHRGNLVSAIQQLLNESF